MEARLYETIGRQQVRIDQLASDNAALLSLLAKIKAGEADPKMVFIEGDRVTVFQPLPESQEAVNEEASK